MFIDNMTGGPKAAAAANSGAVVALTSVPGENQFTIMEEQRKYIARLALDVVQDKMAELSLKFKMGREFERELRPKTIQEAADRLKKGLYTMRDADKKDPIKYPYGGLQEVFSWRGPDDQADEKGFEAAAKDFMTFYAPLLTEIRIFDPKDGLESFKKIEAYQI